MSDAAADDLHSWRCGYPDRYGQCDCVDRLVEDLASLVEPRR